MAETYGRNPESFELYREGLPLKSAEQIQQYSEAFFSQYERVSGWPKLLERITKGEQEIEKRKQVRSVIAQKFSQISQKLELD
jgi:hypothetical protein